ncbi:hypothetical protein GF373_13235, partial [bacterium]|nr:hypothetical protein [bacterium]
MVTRTNKIIAINESAQKGKAVRDIPFELVSQYKPMGDQPKAIEELTQ